LHDTIDIEGRPDSSQLVVRNLEDDMKAKRRRRANAHEFAVVEEARSILAVEIGAEPGQETGLGTSIAALFAGIGLPDGEEIQELRGYAPKPATFD
jgi:plasmid stability protein